MITRTIHRAAGVAALLLAFGGSVSVSGQLAEPGKPAFKSFPPVPTYQDATPYSGDVKLDPQIQKIIDDFFDLLQLNHVEQAYDQLTKGTKIADKPEDVETLKSKTNQAINIYGDFIGREVVSVQYVGTHLVRATYVSLGKNYPLRWRFYFFRNDRTWHLLDIRVDDRLIDMFDEKAGGTGEDSK